MVSLTDAPTEENTEYGDDCEDVDESENDNVDDGGGGRRVLAIELFEKQGGRRRWQ